ncbi:hypothetical protein ACFE04_028432 [Oxalis oulophora]
MESVTITNPFDGTDFTDVKVIPEHQNKELHHSITNLEGEIVQLKQKQNLLDEKRGEALNKILDIKGSIRVFCRIRPLLSTDRRVIHRPIIVGSEKITVSSSGSRKEFDFDKVFPQEATQEEIFVEVAPILRSALDGHNVCLLAYGQTGTGKTFTMDGANNQPGIIPRALEELFSQASLDMSSSISFSMSMLEVYMGNLRDLLVSKPAARSYEPVTRCNLNIQTDPKGFVEIEGLTEVSVQNFGKAKWWYNKGRRIRSTSWTNVNESSSRSHCLTRITIFRNGDSPEAKKELSKLWMVDLGGSERLLKTGAIGQTLDEGRAINLSLSSLGDVISALRRKKGHVPYRNSKLTQILKDSLGHGAKVLMLVHVSPCDDDVGETICSLAFAKRARGVESTRELAGGLKKQREKRINELEEDMREAETEYKRITVQIQKAKSLLNESKILLLKTFHLEEVEKNTEECPKEELFLTPKISDKPSNRKLSGSLPRFMTSTAASRHRLNSIEKEILLRPRSLRSVTKSSMQFSYSQSFISDARLKAILRSSNKKTDTIVPVIEISNVEALPESKMVALSDPNFRVAKGYHRRRMSSLI